MSVLKQDPTATPSSPRSSRIPGLDLVRGIAIIGTLATNIWLFTHVGGMLGSLDDPVTPGTPPTAAAAQQVLTTVSNGKFLGLLTLMFGIGLELQRRSRANAGLRWPGSYLWRAALLLVDGVINFILIVEFDVLMGYAITGGVVAYLMLTSERAQRVWIWVTGMLHVVIITLLSGAMLALESSGAPMNVPDPATAYPYANGSFLDLVRFRLDNVLLFRAEPILIFAMSIAMFLLGAHLLRTGIFSPEGARLRTRLMILGLACAAPVDLAVGVFGGTGGFFFGRYVLAPVVALGLLALIAHISLRTSPSTWLSLRLQEVGRVALSGYILQNLIGSFLFYGWGLGLAAQLGSWRVPATVAAFVVISALVLSFAHLWLRRFRQGPVEWLWATSYTALSGSRVRRR